MYIAFGIAANGGNFFDMGSLGQVNGFIDQFGGVIQARAVCQSQNHMLSIGAGKMEPGFFQVL